MGMANVQEQQTWEQEILQLEEESREAFIARDINRVARLFSEDLLVNSPINRVNTKQQVLDLLEAGLIAHATLDSEIEELRLYGDLAVVMGKEVLTNTVDGPIITRRFTNVWKSTDQGWKLFIRHANIIQPPEVNNSPA